VVLETPGEIDNYFGAIQTGGIICYNKKNANLERRVSTNMEQAEETQKVVETPQAPKTTEKTEDQTSPPAEKVEPKSEKEEPKSDKIVDLAVALAVVAIFSLGLSPLGNFSELGASGIASILAGLGLFFVGAVALVIAIYWGKE
jgi:hypothetical protein